MKEVVQEITALLKMGDQQRYGAEAVSQLTHALQCAHLAEQADASPELITACLLHDIGHLLGNLKEEVALSRGVDLAHEEKGRQFLEKWFSLAVSEPVRLHVQAKRYLCQLESDYWATLSPISKRTLELQGGIFSQAEATAFIAQPQAVQSVQLRRWDDLAKVKDLETPDLEHYIPFMLHILENKDA